MNDVLNTYFLDKIGKIKRDAFSVDPIIQLIYHSTTDSLDHFAKLTCYSYKQFERHFYARTGVTPRYYKRLVKFDHVFRLKNLPVKKSWRDIA